MATKKRRLNVRAKEDEAVVVAPLEVWNFLEEMFEDFANELADPEDEGDEQIQSRWIDLRDHFRYWVEKTKDREFDQME